LRGAFTAIVNHGGARYENHQRFTALRNDGKPLWEFKEFDHRLYAVREQIGERAVRIILLNGWVKDKGGKAKEERGKIETALNLYQEYRKENCE
jgi:hypothetical protein